MFKPIVNGTFSPWFYIYIAYTSHQVEKNGKETESRKTRNMTNPLICNQTYSQMTPWIPNLRRKRDKPNNHPFQ